MAVPSLDEFKAFANITSSSNDAELALHLAAALDVAEGIVGPIRPGLVTETHYGVAGRQIVLRRAPVGAVGAISAPTWTPLLADFVVDPDTGVLRRLDGRYIHGDITVTYSVGGFVPDAVTLAVYIIAGHLWETQRGNAPSALALQGADQPQPGWSGFAIPNRASDLLGPYRQIPVS